MTVRQPEKSIPAIKNQAQPRLRSDEAMLLHVTGQSRFICDEPKPEHLCHAVIVPNPHPHARITRIDSTVAKKMDGAIAVLTASDIPGENQLGVKFKDEPLLPESEVCYIGQPVALVVAETRESAKRASLSVQVDYEILEPILTIDHANQLNSLIAPEFGLSSGDLEAGFQNSEHILEGVVSSSSQEHVYFETQRVRAVPGEGREMTLYCGTQSPSEVQHLTAHVLGVDRKDITVDVKRLGGAFGGKESAAALWGGLAALAAHHTKRPVELKLDRADDMQWTGKRHPFKSRYRVGFDSTGRILAYSVNFHADAGASADLTMAIMQRAVLHAENVYHIPNIEVRAKPLRTHLPPNTAFRGFGAPQGIFVIESVIQRIARALNKDPLNIRKLNAYRDGDTAPYGRVLREVNALPLMERIEAHAHYADLKKAVHEFNHQHRFRKQGIGIVPLKFGISFTTPFLNQGSALVHLYADGSVSVSHGGIEMGQGVNTKVARIVADEMGVSLDQVKIESHNTKRTANTSPTAASTGADINGNAALNAARMIMDRLRPVATELLQLKFGVDISPERVAFGSGRAFDPAVPESTVALAEIASHAWQRRIDLSAHGYYSTPGLNFDWESGRGAPFAYYVYGCGLVVAEVDILTGEVSLTDAFLIHETSKSVDTKVDRGQIEGS
jgi:xanthine dehydrogenase large subunit